MENDEAPEGGVTHRHGRLQEARRRVGFVEVNVRVALVRSHDEVVLLGQCQGTLHPRERGHGAGRVARRAQEQDLAALPHFC